MSAFRDAVYEDHHKMRRGENGCVEYTDAGIGSDILALSQRVRGGDVRSLCRAVLERRDPQEITQLVLLLFVTRNTRGGKGEKKLAYEMYLELWRLYPDTATELLQLFPLYGYWKDIFLLMEFSKDHPYSKPLEAAALSLIREQWNKDLAELSNYKLALEAAIKVGDKAKEEKIRKAGPKISLLAKWLPREGKRLDKKLGFVKKFSEAVYGDGDMGDTAMENA